MVKKAGNQMENGKRVSQKMVFKVLLQWKMKLKTQIMEMLLVFGKTSLKTEKI
jgi:hypothetical protein